MVDALEILLIEGNEEDINFIRSALQEKKKPIHLNTVSNETQALEYLYRKGQYVKAELPNLILLDLNLPTINGHNLLAKIKGSQPLKCIPVIIFDSSESDIDAFRAYALGANCYITKGRDLEQFSQAINALIDFWTATPKLPDLRFINYYNEGNEVLRLSEKQTSNWPPPIELRILLVENEITDSELTKEMLSEECGVTFNVEVASTLKSAIENLEQNSFDAIVLDLGLPDSEGIHTFNRIYAKSNNGSIPIIIYTGFYQNEFAMQAVRGGAQDYLIKGEVNRHLLSRVIRYAIERRIVEEERTRFMVNEHKTRENAEKALLAGNEFVSMVIHELRTPLTSIKLLLGLCLKIVEQDTVNDSLKSLREMLYTSEQQTDRLARITKDLVDVSLIKLDNLCLQVERVDLSKLVREILVGLGWQLEKAQCTVTVNIDPGIIGNWDRFRLEQVLINLLTNAMKYGAGNPIELSLHRQSDEAVLSVRDHGIGIAEKDQQRIFDRFVRTNLAKQHGSGFGLGLYIVREILNAQGGYIEVTSSVGEGSTFTVVLPIFDFNLIQSTYDLKS